MRDKRHDRAADGPHITAPATPTTAMLDAGIRSLTGHTPQTLTGEPLYHARAAVLRAWKAMHHAHTTTGKENR